MWRRERRPVLAYVKNVNCGMSELKPGLRRDMVRHMSV